MKLCNKLWMATLCAFAAIVSLPAQNSVDLDAQRKESQKICVIPGEKLDHQGIVINPTPQLMHVYKANRLAVDVAFKVIDRKKCFSNAVGFLNQQAKGVKLEIDFGEKLAAKYQISQVSGSYQLLINEKGVNIMGYDECGAFYGLQTLRHLLASPDVQANGLPYLRIDDFPSLTTRGVVEGFYGNPWAHEVRLSLIDFYGRFKLNTYIFGPKDDPYHSTPHWREPYPAKEAEQIKELVEACKRNYVNFVWAIHPGKDIRWNEEDYNNLINKFQAMYDMGVRSFAIFFDDISGEGTNPEKQANLLNRLVKEFIEVKGDVSPLIFCPTDYTKAWANATPEGSLPRFGKTLHPSIKVFWTGDAVCSDVTKSTLDWLNSRIKRPALFWWNYPVTDYVRNIILQGPVYGLDTTLKQDRDLCGMVSNPMEHGEASKLALYSVADYSWNVPSYNPMDSWERALVELAGEAAAPAYRTFAIHSGDTGAGYRRDESWETTTFEMADYEQADVETLKKEFERIERVAMEMQLNCNNAPLMKELLPWLEEFSKLGTRCRKALDIIKLYKSGDASAFWNAYVDNTMSLQQRSDYDAHLSGGLKLQPFYENAMDYMLVNFFKQLTGHVPTICKGVGSYSNLKKPPHKLMLDNDTTTYYTSGWGQKTDQWVGLDLGSVQDIYEVDILQGRNSVNDVDYYDRLALEYSVDGQEWLPLVEEINKKYVIHWEGEGVKGQFVRMRKLASAKRNWVAVRSFVVNPVRADKLGFNMDAQNKQAALLAFDRHPSTSYINAGTLTFDVPQGVEQFTILSRPSSVAMVIRQFAADGTLLSLTSTAEAFCPVALSAKTHHITIEGEREIFEVAF